ncbi:MAG: hypothetical protein QOE95_99 [Gaiellaceae bacterium]|nr:hypothetical protein [Gaiellaceae bacterium]
MRIARDHGHACALSCGRRDEERDQGGEKRLHANDPGGAQGTEPPFGGKGFDPATDRVFTL